MWLGKDLRCECCAHGCGCMNGAPVFERPLLLPHFCHLPSADSSSSYSWGPGGLSLQGVTRLRVFPCGSCLLNYVSVKGDHCVAFLLWLCSLTSILLVFRSNCPEASIKFASGTRSLGLERILVSLGNLLPALLSSGQRS